MAVQSVYKGYGGSSFVPFGLIVVATPGTPVRMTSLIDPSSNNDPSTFTPAASANNTGAAVPSNEFTARFQQIMIQGFKAGATHGLQNNTGNIYVVLSGDGKGSANRDDYGAMVLCVAPGQTAFLASAPQNMDVYSPYKLFIDADSAGDSALCMGISQ